MGAGRALRSMGLTPRRIAVAAGVAVLLIAGISVILAAPGHSQAVQDGAVAALLVAAAGTVVVLVRQPGKGGPDLAALVTTGLAGAALATLLPQTQAFAAQELLNRWWGRPATAMTGEGDTEPAKVELLVVNESTHSWSVQDLRDEDAALAEIPRLLLVGFLERQRTGCPARPYRNSRSR